MIRWTWRRLWLGWIWKLHKLCRGRSHETAVTAIVLSAGLLFSPGHSSTAEMPYAPARPDARRLKTGQFDYRDTNDGKPLGTSRISIEKIGTDEEYNFSAETIGYGDQQWESIATSSFAPISARLSFGKAGNRSPSFDLKYAAGRVSGFAVSHARSEAAIRHTVDARITLDTVDQRIDWATVLASDLKPGARFRFSVYDPAIGISRSLRRLVLSNKSVFLREFSTLSELSTAWKRRRERSAISFLPASNSRG